MASNIRNLLRNTVRNDFKRHLTLAQQIELLGFVGTAGIDIPLNPNNIIQILTVAKHHLLLQSDRKIDANA